MNKKPIWRNQLLARFLNYVNYDTQAKAGAKTSPSCQGQWLLARLLQQELIQLGLQQVELTSHCVLTAFLPTNQSTPQPTIGLISHLDTATELKGKRVKPEVIEQYRGGDIALGLGDVFISPVEFTFLQKLVGHTLIVADGTTLLGADNKAGIAEIITALDQLIQSNQARPNLRIAFTPDEEIGLGMKFFPIDSFKCDWAYTIDGGELGELEYENFNAASATIKIKGRNIHTGNAKNKLINALAIACQFQQALPENEVPEQTENREGFFHLQTFNGDIEHCELHYLIRDFDQNKFNQRKQLLNEIANSLTQKHQLPTAIEVNIKDNYQNMYQAIMKVPQSVDLADQAMKNCGITPNHKVIRGGTDGAWLAQNGIACPNIFTGGYNFHSRHELASLDMMQQTVNVLLEICRLAVKA